MFVITNKPHDGAPSIFGPYPTVSDAEAELQRLQQKYGGRVKSNTGYWNKNPCWVCEDLEGYDETGLMTIVKLEDTQEFEKDFDKYLEDIMA